MSFVARHGLWSDDQARQAVALAERIEREGLEVVRFSFPDLHGLLRGKELTAAAVAGALRDGVSITSTLLLKDTSHRTVAPIFTAQAGIGVAELQGGRDMVMVADPTTFQVLPWAVRTGWMLCDLYFTDGRPVPFATRHLCRSMSARLDETGFSLLAGLEIEFHITRLTDPMLGLADSGQPGAPPKVALLHQGYSYLTEHRLDQIEPILEILRRDLQLLGLPLASIEVEFGPSQCEFVFGAVRGMQAADDMVLFRSAVKQICQRHGYHASFMCRPAFPNAMSSGWHLHQSLIDGDGGNAFASDEETELSPTGRHYLAGLLACASQAAAFTTPTVNGYKRFRANSLAPDRIAWAHDNRGAMLRVIKGTKAAHSRIENRVGEPGANPYLYLASQIASGLTGMATGNEPPPAVDAPYGAPSDPLPTSLEAALALLDRGSFGSDNFGRDFVDYYLMIKRSEVNRYNYHVSDWEEREYF